ncbi:hypothetical protein BDV93DRAFT_362270 [Ceratobasidium sp. AG-I]|nr:hypothetical protein BDV93DRAFT_362270 [Ceratobasidium sp. AG-I]
MDMPVLGWEAELPDCKRVPVIDFLAFLFGTGVLEDTVKERFRHWHINFSHWISMSKCLEFETTNHASDWTLRHWCRTSAVQGCRDQPLIDKVITMYYYDPTLEQTTPHRVSHILVSDRAQKEHGKSDLPSITRLGSIGCSTSEPYIALLLDLGVGDRLVKFTMDSDESCLRIYAPGLMMSTYPRMDSAVLKTLSDILKVPEQSKYQRSIERIRDQYKYGGTTEETHMAWEAGRRGLK